MFLQRFSWFLISLFLVSFGIACGGGEEETSSEEDQFSSGECDGFCGTEQLDVQVDLSGARALFTVESEESSTSSLVKNLSEPQHLTTSTSSPLFAVTDDGIQAILAAFNPSGEDVVSDLPRLSFVAVSPIGEVYLAFEHPWIYRDEADGVTIGQYSDPWSSSSPFTCQLFVVNQLIGVASSPDAMNLSCVKNGIEINTWDARTKRIQFDASGNAYFAAHVPGNWKDLLWKYTTIHSGSDSTATASATIDEGQITEIINANICFERFLITEAGGVLYTGRTSTTGECQGDSFFRFVTPAGGLQQISSGWWDYVFAPIESSLENGTEENDFYNGQILFYGPDPLVATAPDWNDACLFRFDPAATGTDRSTQIADCSIDIWQYLTFDADGNANSDAVRKTRCQEEKNMLGGNNAPGKILLSDTLDGDSLDEIYVVGDVFEKDASEWRCDLCTTDTPSSYCVVGETLHFEATTSSACTTAGGSFVTTQRCYNNQIDQTSTGSVCKQSTLPTNWEINGQWCDFSDAERSTRSAIARVDENYDGDGNNRIVRLSGDDEIVDNGWAIEGRLAYLAFNSEIGAFELKEVGVDAALLTGIEVYELMLDPRDDTKWFFNGLRFSDNAYVTGSFNPDADDPESTLDIETELTGQIDTLVIVPSL